MLPYDLAQTYTQIHMPKQTYTRVSSQPAPAKELNEFDQRARRDTKTQVVNAN